MWCDEHLFDLKIQTIMYILLSRQKIQSEIISTFLPYQNSDRESIV
jgi:hypothetical protein